MSMGGKRPNKGGEPRKTMKGKSRKGLKAIVIGEIEMKGTPKQEEEV